MIKVAVTGASGYMGAELLRLLSVHPKVRITVQEFWLPFDIYDVTFKERPKKVDHNAPTGAELKGEETAKRIQLQIEYEPEPPFHAGTPFTAPPETVAAQRTAGAERRRIREAAVRKAAAALAATAKARSA